MRTFTFLLLSVLAVGLTGCASKPATLREALKNKFLIGTALNAPTILGTDTMSANIVKQQFSAIVPENCMKSMEIQPVEGQFRWDLADKFVEFGEKNGLTVTGHCLIWHSQLPRWFTRDSVGGLASAELLKQRMKTHISTVVGRYKGRIKGWDVVNEAIMEDGSYRNSDFYKILGEEFIPLAFQYAHEADPNCELYYNDYNEWYPEKRKTVVRLIKTLKERGLRIDAIGMQGHIGMTSPTIEEYQATVDDYTNAGVKVCVTELDMSALPEPRRQGGANVSDFEAYRAEMNPYTEGLPADVEAAWTARMMEFFDLFLKNKDHFLRVTVWGVSDKDSWKNNFPMPRRTDYPLLFDRNYQPKPIVAEIIKAAE